LFGLYRRRGVYFGVDFGNFSDHVGCNYHVCQEDYEENNCTDTVESACHFASVDGVDSELIKKLAMIEE